MKAKQSLYYKYAQVSFSLKAVFYAELKTRRSYTPQALRIAFLAYVSAVLQPEH